MKETLYFCDLCKEMIGDAPDLRKPAANLRRMQSLMHGGITLAPCGLEHSELQVCEICLKTLQSNANALWPPEPKPDEDEWDSRYGW